MAIIEYKFDEFTNKDMFEMRLAGVIPDFGYIPCTKRKPFFDFCVENGFISKYASTSSSSLFSGEAAIYHIHVTFQFAGMLNYNPKPIIMQEDVNMAIVYKNFKMKNIGQDIW